jgi:hypothetical protein
MSSHSMQHRFQRRSGPSPSARVQNFTSHPGWSRPFPAFVEARWHYYKAGSTKSLCGRVLYTGGKREDGDDTRDGACRDCQNALKSVRKAGA